MHLPDDAFTAGCDRPSMPELRIAAVTVLMTIQNMIGHGFHPDSPILDYQHKVGDTLVPSFSENEAHCLQNGLDFCRDILGDKIYQPDLWM